MARIIVIDDDEGIRGMLRRALEAAGHDVREASEGARGLALLAAEDADLVITDIFMPGQDGIELARHMRKEFPKVKLIAMSGGGSTGQIDLREDMRMFGAVRSLAKPFSRADLVKTVGEVLEGHRP
jgi:DNA-binding NtrC family response regulator